MYTKRRRVEEEQDLHKEGCNYETMGRSYRKRKCGFDIEDVQGAMTGE